MTTPRIRSLVSLTAALIVALTVGACASGGSRLTSDGLAVADAQPASIHFDNEGRDYVRVYLVGLKQEWSLGRVAPGARVTLRIPDAALAEDAGVIRLTVLPGDRVTLRAANETRAATMVALPAAEVLAQRWTYSQLTSTDQLSSVRLGARRAAAGRP
ncbi:MAG: hypothetical protein ABI969_10860 [bacterium]